MKLPRIARLSTFWDTLRTSYWFVPTIMSIASVLLWIAVFWLESRLGDKLVQNLGWIYSGGPDGASELLSVVAGSMITIAGVTFSITIVALTLGSQQFGPFLLRNFMRDAGNQIVLGTFISTFIFSLLTLRMIRGDGNTTFVPYLSVSVATLLTMLSLGVLIYFIHHVSALIQASNIISVVSRDLEESVDRLFPERLGFNFGEDENVKSSRQKVIKELEVDSSPVRSPGYGYVKALDNETLLKTATENDIVVRMLMKPGDFIGEGDIIASVTPGESLNRELEEAINDSVVLGAQRTVTQDVEFVFNQIVEVAVRALSTGINDPFTAVVCIDHLGQGLRLLAGREMPSPFRYDGDGNLRVVAHPVSFPDMANSVINPIRYYGRSSPMALCRLLTTISAIAPHLKRKDDQHSLWLHAGFILETAVDGLSDNEAIAQVKNAYSETAKILKNAGNPT